MERYIVLVKDSAAAEVAAGEHGEVNYQRGTGRITSIRLRADTSQRAAENRFHEVLHVLSLLSNTDRDISHDTIRRLARAYSQNEGAILQLLRG